ncbi:MAG TPA: TIGR03943 family protein [Actinomycetota bacterium]|nr:TIGR03943 family protein [Actinomycetota bacterium]
MRDAVVIRGTTPVHAAETRTRHVSPSRLAGAAVLGAWALLFWWLLLSGRENLYLSTRTQWVVPIGATLLTLASLGRLATVRAREREPVRRREAWIMGALVAPVVLIMALPPATLGQFSAGKRSSVASAGVATSAADIGSGALTLVDVAAGQTTPEGETALAARAGEQVDFVGFVTRFDDTPADELLLTRYVVTCCVADATIAQVRVVNVTPGAFQPNDWVEVRGAIYPIGREVIVNAADVQPVPRPEKPYLTP